MWDELPKKKGDFIDVLAFRDLLAKARLGAEHECTARRVVTCQQELEEQSPHERGLGFRKFAFKARFLGRLLSAQVDRSFKGPRSTAGRRAF